MRLRPRPPSSKRSPVAGRVRLPGEPSPEPRRGDRHRGARGGTATVVELGDVGGEAHVIERATGEPSVEAAQSAGVGAAGIGADRGVDQAARRGRGVADVCSGRGDLGERIPTDNGNYR